VENRRPLETAQRRIAIAMGACMALAWAPFVGGVLAGFVQMRLVRVLLRTFERPNDPATVETFMWFFTKKTLYLTAATYAPTIGPAVQVVLTYALGQLVVRCATDDDFDAKTERWLDDRWNEIEEDIFSGENVVGSYEQFSGKPFPARFKPRIVGAIDAMSALYRKAERIPGLAESQDAIGGAMKRGAFAVRAFFTRLRRPKP
jgi:hypothetical protein